MDTLQSIAAFAIVLGIIVLVHEFGHYIAARLTGVRVEVFSFGFGKRLLGKKIGDTDFRLSLIPLGGYVKMAGEEEYDPKDLKPYEFQAKNRAQKIFILIMGPAMNLVLAFLIFTAINITGVEVETYKKEPPRIGYIEKGSPAEEAGLQKGDLVRTIDDSTIANWLELEIAIGSNPNSEITIEFERDGEVLTRKLDVKTTPSYGGIGDAGISWDYRTEIISVNKDSPAARAGLEPGDVILAIDNEPLHYTDVIKLISENADKELLLRIKRGENQLENKVTPRKVYILQSPLIEELKTGTQKLKAIRKALPDLKFNLYREENKYKIISRDLESREEAEKYPGTAGLPCSLTVKGRGIIGISMSQYSPTITTYYGLLGAMKKSIDDIANLTFLVFNAFKKMIVGKLSPKTLSGPIEIAKFSKTAMERGISNFFMLIAFISLQLGIINLFPIPALDGGHLMIFSIEAVIRKEFSQKVKAILMNIGFFILIALMVFVILNDIAKTLPNGWNSLLPF